jgi:hypothetical protein
MRGPDLPYEGRTTLVVSAWSGRVPEVPKRTAERRSASMPMGKERTKEELYRDAKRLGIKGRSKMNKGQLEAALSRRGR